MELGDKRDDVIRNRELVCQTLGSNIDSMVAMQQSHSANVKVIDECYKGKGAREWEDGIENTDGIWTEVVCSVPEKQDEHSRGRARQDTIASDISSIGYLFSGHSLFWSSLIPGCVHRSLRTNIPDISREAPHPLFLSDASEESR